MKGKKSTRSAFLTSLMSLVLCFAMLLGTTLAWFTDTATSGVNRIVAGNLDVEVEYSKTGNANDWTNIQGTTTLFSENLWEPGHTEFVYLRVKNAGTLGLNYKVMVSPISENGGINVAGNSFKLSDYLVFGTYMTADKSCPSFGSGDTGRQAARTAVGTTMGLNQANLTKTGTMVGKDADGYADQYLALVVYMPETVGNEANAKPGTVAPSIDLGITVVATQLENESDSFDNTYDHDAVTDTKYVAGAYYDYFEAVNVSATANDDGTFTVTKTESPAAGSAVIASASGTAAVGATVNMVVTKTSTPSGNFGITVADGHELNGYDIKVTGQAADSVVQGKLYVGTGLENFVFYHNSAPMVKKESGELANNEYRYNPADGFVYFATKTFSPFQATYKAPVAAIGTAVYGTVQDAINAAPKNASSATVITILKDVVGGAAFGYPDSTKDAGRNVTIDFAGHSYEFKTPGMGSTGTETQAMHLINGNTMTLKNGTISIAKDATDILMMIMNYCDLTLDNMTVDCTNAKFSYNNSICRGNVTVTGNTNLIASSATAKIFDVDGAYSSGQHTVSVTFDENYTGTTSGVIEYVASTGAGSSKLTIKAGTFTGKITSSGSTKPIITGGTFVSDPSAYLADGYEAKLSGNMYVVSKITYWSDYAAESYATPIDTANKVLTIASAGELALFAEEVNGGNNYRGYTVKLANDIDLAGKRWYPISDFAGTFDGSAYTIKNLEIQLPGAWYVGFFAKCANGSKIQNVTFENANVAGGHCSSVVNGGSGGSEATFDSVTVKGDIQLTGGWYVGAILGKGYSKITNCNVVVNEGSKIVCDGGYAGGIVGFMGEGNHYTTSCTVENLFIESYWNGIGGISGILHYGNTIDNCIVKNTIVHQNTDDPDEIGRAAMIAGTYLTHENYTETLTNCKFIGGKVYDNTADYTGVNWIGGPWNGYQPNVGHVEIGNNTYISQN